LVQGALIGRITDAIILVLTAECLLGASGWKWEVLEFENFGEWLK
jgi:hypothetical protein